MVHTHLRHRARAWRHGMPLMAHSRGVVRPLNLASLSPQASLHKGALVVHVNPLVTSYSTRRMALVASALAGLSLLAACGDSDTAKAGKSAVENSQNAARLQASAGDVRPADALVRQVNEIPIRDLSRFQNEVARLRNTANSESFKAYIQQRAAAEDLKQASELLTKALATGPAAPLKAIIQAQQGNVANQQAQLHLGQLEETLRSLAVRAAEIQVLADRVVTSTSIAQVAEARGSDTPAEITNALEAANTALSRAQADFQQKQQAAKDLADQIASRRQQAQQQYERAMADQQAAEQASGQASIDAYRKAMDLKGQADQLMEDISNLTPKAQAAAEDARLADLNRQEAQATLDALTQTASAFTNRSQAATTEAKALRDAARKLIEEQKAGLADQLKAFSADWARISAEVEQVRKFANDAATNYASAAAGVPTDREPLADLDRQLRALLQIAQGTAYYRIGQANLVQWAAADLLNRTTAVVSMAYKMANYADTPSDAGNALATARKDALDAFAKADGIFENATKGSTPDTSAPKWLAFSLRASVNNALAIVADPRDVPEKRKLAAESAQQALQRNPSLPLRGLAGNANP